MMVNLDGERFTDEAPILTCTHTLVCVVSFTTTEFGHFQVFDQQTVPLLETRYNTGVPVTADTFRSG
jgi:hypothetical protein